MFKLGFAILFVVFFACNFSESSSAEFPEKQRDVITEDEGPRKLHQKVDGFSEDAVYDDDELTRAVSDDKNGEVDDDDSESRDESKKEDEMAQQSRKRRYNYICNMPSFICCGGRVQYKPRGACCGTRAYDTQKCLCCAGTVRYKPAGSPRCCGTQAYNAQSHVCCRGTIQPRPNGSPACCGTRAYDSQECLCCSGTVRYKPPGRPRCCGTQAYNAQSKICCGRTVQSSLQACCRFQRYGDFQHYMCCGGVLRRKPAGFPRCCGTYAYDYQRFTCIGGNMKRIPPGSPTNPVK